MKTHHDHGNSYKAINWSEAWLKFQRFSSSSLSSFLGHGYIQLDIVLGMEFYILFHKQQEVNFVILEIAWTYKTPKPASIVTRFLQQGHAYANKASPLNSVTLYDPNIQTHESIISIAIQTTTVDLQSRTKNKGGVAKKCM